MPLTLKKIANNTEMETHLELRRSVFQIELGYPTNEEYDINTKPKTGQNYYLALLDDKVIGTCIWGDNRTGYKIERFCLLPEYRKLGHGKNMMMALLNEIPKNQKIYLAAPAELVGYFESLGFMAKGDAFWDFGISHRYMKYKG